MRYAHNVARVLAVPTEAVALLATLMLRGPQTPGEIRINCERLHRFADISSVEAYLNELAARPAGALVVELPRAAGSREARWRHLLSGGPTMSPEARPVAQAGSDVGTLQNDLDALRRELDDIKATLKRVMEELGLSR